MEELPKWRTWLQQHNVPVSEIFLRDVRASIYLRDPDGVLVEITASNVDSLTMDYLRERAKHFGTISSIDSDMKLIKFDHASPVTSDSELTKKYLDKFVGLTKSSAKENPDQKGTQLIEVGSE